MGETVESEIVCIGEILWDSLPLGLFLGGAPFNVAYHLHRMGEPVVIASSVGDDRLGLEARRRMRWKGMSDDLVQVTRDYPTGLVEVTVDTEGVPDYTIVEPVAWDHIRRTEELVDRVADARALVFGSLAQRSSVSRDTIQQLYRSDTVTVFDVNLRPPFDSRAVVADSLRHTDIVKLNDDEFQQLCEWFGWEQSGTAGPIDNLIDQFGCETICITRGDEGALLVHQGTRVERPGVPVEVVDTVGAGDAFLAALLSGLFQGFSPGRVLARANRMGAHLATRFGATPDYDPETVLNTASDEARDI